MDRMTYTKIALTLSIVLMIVYMAGEKYHARYKATKAQEQEVRELLRKESIKWDMKQIRKLYGMIDWNRVRHLRGE